MGIRYLFTLIFIFSFSFSANIGDVVSNIATSTFSVNSIDKNATSNEVNSTVEGTEASIEFLHIDEKAPQKYILGSSMYLGNDGTFHALAKPKRANGVEISTTSTVGMTSKGIYNVDDLLLIKVVDLDQNNNNAIRNTINITLTSPSGDKETIKLIETTVNSGIFTGYTNLVSSKSTTSDGNLHVENGEQIKANYEDQDTSIKTSSAIVMKQDNLNIWITKQVNKQIASIGEMLSYTITIHNDESFSVPNMQIDDFMPYGLKLIEDSATINKSKITPTPSKDGKHLYFDIPNLLAKSKTEIVFYAQVTAGILDKKVVNHAVVHEKYCSPTTSTVHKKGQKIDVFNAKDILKNNSCIFTSNVAEASTSIKEELTRETGIIVGQIYECPYVNNKNGHGIKDVRLYMENGTYVTSDTKGKYHIEGVKTGTHILQVDVDMLPNGYELKNNVKNARHAGRDFSQFISMGRGALKRVDFCLSRKANSGIVDITNNNTNTYNYAKPTSVAKMPNYNATHIRSMAGKTAILWPPKGFIPSIPSTRIAVVYDKANKAEVWLNGIKTSMLNFDHKKTDANSTTVIDTYKGIDLLDNTNTIEIKIINEQKRVIKTLTRTIHVSNAPAKVEYIKKNSFVVADGKHSPVIAVRFTDTDGYPLRSGTIGTFSIDAPYRSQVATDQMQQNSLSSGKEQYTIDSKGIAYIKLQATTKSGVASLHFKIRGRDEVIRAWIKPKPRKWIMVGFAEGTVGYNTLKGHEESLSAIGAKEKLVKKGRVSFFAKGQIKGEWLLTMAYDTGKDTKNTKLFDEIDPNKYYTLYNDGSNQKYEASSRKKLFLKIEKERFSALLGDLNTDMTVTELSKYSRRLTGVKTEYHDDNIDASAFGSQTESIFVKDEIRGDGTSGFYYLKNRPIIVNSESINIQVRDRYKNQDVINTKTLQRFKDYEIDYDRGTIYFKEPIYGSDADFNPRFIVVDYEIDGGGSKHYAYGGHATLKAFKDAFKIGASYISEDNAKKMSKLYGVDTSIKVGASTVIKAEYAKTQTTQNKKTNYGDAKLAEIVHVSNNLYARLYYREQKNNFGLGQISGRLGGTRKVGIDASKTFTNRLKLHLVSFRDSELLTKKNQDVLEFKAQLKKTLWNVYAGYRYAKNTDTNSVQQMLLGASYAFFDQKLKLSVNHDQSFGKDEDKIYPTKSTVGFSYAITAKIDLFASYELAKGTKAQKQGRIGTLYKPWSGMNIKNTTISELENDTKRIYNTLGMLQTYQFNKNWGMDIGYELGKVVDGNTTKNKVNFKAYRLGINYHAGIWKTLLSGEYRDAKKDKKYNATLGAYAQANKDLAFALSAGYNKLKYELGKKEDANMRMSMAYRPVQTDIILLSKLDLIHNKINTSKENIYTQKIINNFLANYTPNKKAEISFQHGIKYVKDTTEDFEHKGITQLFGIDGHYDIWEKWEIGTQGSFLYAQSAKNSDYSVGIYAGYNLFNNTLITAGYNMKGFQDTDFSLQTYRITGPYVQFKIKFDQKNFEQLLTSFN